MFFNLLFVGKNVKTKVASIGHAIIQASWPRILLSYLQLGHGVQLHHHFQSKFLIDVLHALGFWCSYAEVQKFEMCAAMGQGTHIPNITEGHFMQYAADNVDHNVCTLDGMNTFHGMGITYPKNENRLNEWRSLNRIYWISDASTYKESSKKERRRNPFSINI